jgi:hypothetical protein
MSDLDVMSEFLQYNKDEGSFIWKKSPCNKIKVGSAAGSVAKDGYLRVIFRRRQYQLHRVVWLFEKGAWPKYEIDHIDGNRSNNHISNLRDVTHSVNLQNKKSVNKSNRSSGLLGVSWNKSVAKWQASICLNGSAKYLGVFDSAIEAHETYLHHKRKIHVGCTI